MEPLPPNVFSENLYERLGIQPYATVGEIEQQWRRRVGELKGDGVSEMTMLLNEAKNVLSNPKLRAVYDKEGLSGVKLLVKKARKAKEAAEKAGAGRTASENETMAAMASMAAKAGERAGLPTVPQRRAVKRRGVPVLWLVVGAACLMCLLTLGVALWIVRSRPSEARVAGEVSPPQVAVAAPPSAVPESPASPEPVAPVGPAGAPPGKPAKPAGVVIVEATWGVPGKTVDVTKILRDHMQNGKLDMPLDYKVLGDPAPKAAKEAIVTYEIDGKRTTKTFTGKQRIVLAAAPAVAVRPAPPGRPTLPAGPQVKDWTARIAAVRQSQPEGLIVLEATWGTGTTAKDVTDACQGLVLGDSLTVPAGAKAFKLAENGNSGLNITYTLDGTEIINNHVDGGATLQIGPQVTSLARVDGEVVTVAVAVAEKREKYGDGLLILRSSYGLGSSLADVSEQLQARVSGGRLLTSVGGTDWPDPSYGAVKNLEFVYWDGQTAKSMSGKEGDPIDIAAVVPENLKTLVTLPAFVAVGQALVHHYAVEGNYALVSGPAGAVLSANGELRWTPAEGQLGVQEIKFKIIAEAQEHLMVHKTEVVSAAVAASVGGDLGKLQNLARLDLGSEALAYQTDFDRKDGLLLEKDKLTVLGPDGITVSKSIKLAKTYVRIAERDDYYVAIRLDPVAMDLLDKQTGKAIKTIKLDYRAFHDLVLLPGRKVSLVSAEMSMTIPRDRIAIIDETTGDVREPKNLVGTFMQLDHSGEHLWVGIKDLYENGANFMIDPNFNVMTIPTYGTIDILARYDVVESELVLKTHLSTVGKNGNGVRISPDGKRATYLSFTGFPEFTHNLAGWSADDLEKKPVVYDLKNITGGRGAQDMEYHPILPLVLITKADGVVIFGRESSDVEPDRIKIAAGALAGVTVRNAHFSPDGLSVIMDCQHGQKFYLCRIPLLMTDAERELIKAGFGPAPGANPPDKGLPPDVQRG